jgi:hypothetical protein
MIVRVIETATAEWWEVELPDMSTGYVPSTYLRVISWRDPAGMRERKGGLTERDRKTEREKESEGEKESE